MPVFCTYKGKPGWITGTVDALRGEGVYRVFLHFGPYDENRPWWDQHRTMTDDDKLVPLDDIQIITTQQAILVGMLIERRLDQIEIQKPIVEPDYDPDWRDVEPEF